MEIEVGEYIRTKNGVIDKVIIDYYGRCNNQNCNCKHVSCQYDYYDEEDIVKHSKNIIDLIEVGDFVNGRKIERVNDYREYKRADFNLDFDDCDAVYNEDIKTILTKEQYNQNCYRLEE